MQIVPVSYAKRVQMTPGHPMKYNYYLGIHYVGLRQGFVMLRSADGPGTEYSNNPGCA